jgi:outer membrane protein
MKGLLRKALLALLLVALPGSSAWAQGRFATVDLRKVFDNYWKTKQADAALKDRAADMEKDHKNMLDDYQKAKNDYTTLLADANNQALSTDEREKRKKAAEDKLKSIKDSEDTIAQYERQARTTLDEQRRRMRDNIVGEIRKVLDAKAKSAGYSLVFDTTAESANSTPFILYSNNENDLTDSLLQQLNAAAPPDLPKTDETPADKKGGSKK